MTTVMSRPDTVETECAAQASPSGEAAESAGRRYLYCIVGGDGPRSFDCPGIGPDRPAVVALAHKSVAAVISRTGTEKFEISRANVLAHQRVMEWVMATGRTVLPVRFNTIAEERNGESADRRIVRCVLEPRQEELAALLSAMNSRAEMGVKGLWPDMNAVFQDIARGHREIALLRRKISRSDGKGPGAIAVQMRLGEMVKAALEDRKQALEKELIACLSPMAVRWRRNKTFGDPMFANLALLVDRSALPRMEAALSGFEQGLGGGVRLRCVGPVPPSNFVELAITWDDEKASP